MRANHKCDLLSQNDYDYYFVKSKEKWDKSLELNVTPPDEGKHRDWADINDWGVTNFGIPPDAFPLDSIRLDTFHMTCAISRKLMKSVREEVKSMSTELKTDFTDEVLRMFF